MLNINNLYERYRQGANWDGPITLTASDLAAIIWVAESHAVRQVCDKHSQILVDARAKARKLRYHRMAEAILPSEDIIRDGRYADAPEIGSWGVGEAYK